MKDENTPGTLFLGIDGGGSKCKARLVDGSGALLGEGVAGPANAFQNRGQACQSVIESARRALAAAGLPASDLGRLVVGAGLAGVNIPRVAGEMEAWQHPFARFYLGTDIHIACLAAHGGQEGAVIVAGTGSVGYRFSGGVGTLLGAHGFPVGDQGSGAWMGLQAVQAVLLTVDGLGPETGLLRLLEAHLGETGHGLVDALFGAPPKTYGTLAPLVLDCAGQGDPVATGIVAEGAGYLSDMAEKLLAGSSDALCMLGGLAEKLRPWMRPEIRGRMVPPQGQPDEGAVCFAMESLRRSG